MDGVFSSGNKRQFMGPQGSKENPDGQDTGRAARDANDPVIRASLDIMKGRKIAAPKSRRGGASRDGSVDRQLGNPFADPAQSNGTNGFNTSPFGQQSAFGSSASQSFPPNTPNNTAFPSQPTHQAFAFGAPPTQSSSSFPPASTPFGQQQQTSLFGGTTTSQPQPQQSAFTFGSSAPAAAAPNNPFSFGVSTPQSTPPIPAFSFGTSTQQPASNASGFSFGNNATPNKPSASTTSTSADASNIFGGASNGFQFGGAGTGSSSNLFGAKSDTPPSPLSFGQSTPAQASNPFVTQTSNSQAAGGLFATKPTTNTPLFAAPATSAPVQSSFSFGTSPMPSSSAAAGFGHHDSIVNTDDMMTSPPVTPPKKPATATEQPPSSTVTTPAFKPSSSGNPFNSLKMPPPPTPSAQINGTTPSQPSQLFGTFGKSTPSNVSTPNLFAAQPNPTPPAKQTPAAAPPSFSFAPTPPAATKPSTFSPAPPQQTPAVTRQAESGPVPDGAATDAQQQYRRLNQSFKARLLSLNDDYDWSPMFQAYLAQVERMKEAYAFKPGTKRTIGLDAEDSDPKRARSTEPEPEPERQPQVPATPPAQQPVTGLFSPQPSTTPTSSPSKSQTANLFASIVGSTPQQSTPQPPTSLFSPQASSATPAQSVNIFASQAASVSQTPNIFASTQATATPESAAPVSTPRETEEQPPNPFTNLKKMPAQPSARKPASQMAAPVAPAMPKFEMPKFSAPSGADAFAAFGAQAEKSKAEAEKAAEKKELEARFDDEYDSDKETESAFNKRVLAEIRAKRAKAKEEKASAPAQAFFEPGKGFSFTSATSSSGKAGESQETPPSSAEATPESAKPTLFSPAPTTAVGGRSIFDTAVKPAASSTNLFGNLAKAPQPPSDDDEDLVDEEQSKATPQPDSNGATGKSLFERMSKPDGAETTKNGHNPTVFGSSFAPEDHTWKNDSPIKFGDNTGSSASPSKSNGLANMATPAPKPFTNIFGSAKANATPSLFSQSPAKPAVGFGFGTSSNGTSAAASLSPASSREGSAATAATTADEVPATTNSDGNNLDGAPPDTQVSLTDLSEEERRNNDVLFEVSSARIQAYDSKAKTWLKRGLGPLRVLKNKESGNAWILARSNPQGKVIVNTGLLAGMSYDSPAKGRVKFPIVDRDGGKMTTVLVTVKEDADAKKLAEVLAGNKPE